MQAERQSAFRFEWDWLCFWLFQIVGHANQCTLYEDSSFCSLNTYS
jgi:hypothetical protein